MSKNSELIITQSQTESELSSKVNMRIEAVNDPKINKALFTIYEKLVEPLRQIETKVSRVDDLRKAIDNNEYYAKHSFKRVIHSSKLLFLPFLIINFIILNKAVFSDNDMLWSLYVPLASVFDTLDGYSNSLIFDILTTIYVIYIFFFRPIVIATIPVWIVVVIKNKNHSAQNKKYKKEINELTPIINQEVDNISKVICFVPPNYRYSQALNFFVDAYANSKIDNLKEAVNLYDTNKYRQDMLDYQKQTVKLLQAIAFSEFE